MNNRSIIYFGGDEQFFKKLADVVESTLKKDNFTIEQVTITEREIISPIKHTLDAPPAVAIIDFSTFTDAAKTLAWHFRINYQTKNIILVAVFTLDEAEETRQIIQLDLVDFVHYKSDDPQKILFDATVLSTKSLAAQKKYAAYDKSSFNTKAFCKSHIIELQKSSIIVQSSIELSDYITNVEIVSPNILPLSNKGLIVTKKTRGHGLTDTTTDYQMLLTLGTNDEKQINPKIYIKWLEESKTEAFFTGRKLLIIQKTLNTLPQILNPNNDQLLHVRYQTRSNQFFRQIQNFRPDFIAYDFEQLPSEATYSLTDEKYLQKYNGMHTFERMITAIKNIDDEYEPEVLVFNNNSPSETFKKILGYDRIKINSNYLDFDSILKAMHISHESKTSQVDQDALVLSPLDRRSRVGIKIDIEIKSLSEHEVIFYTPHKLPPRSILTIEKPHPMHLTIVPSPYLLKEQNDMYPHVGLINRMHEDEVNEIRKYINTLFFQERDKQQKEELEAFQKRNQEEALKHKKKKEDDEEEE